jgi:hypothetical protein
MSEVMVSFPDTSLGSANQLAEDLEQRLVEETSEVQVERHRTDDRNQDFGASLILILGTPAAIAVAKGIANWISKHGDTKVRVTRTKPDGTTEDVIVESTTQNATEILEEILVER